MKKTKSILKKFNSFIITTGVLVLIILLYRTSDLLLSNSLNDYFKLDKKTSNYISFNYAGGDILSIFEVNNPKVYSDFKGKNFVGEYYDFSINESNDNTGETLEYDIILKDMGNNINNKFIKVYLTDQWNKPLEGFEGKVPVYSAFLNSDDGKIIYSGKVDKSNKNFRLRIWISDVHDDKYNDNLVYQIKVNIK